MKRSVSRALRWVLTIAIVVFLVIFARTINWTEAWHSIRSASLPLLGIAVAVNLSTVIIKAIRWWVFLKPAGSPSLPLAVRATVAGAGLNNVLVANGGDAARVVFVSRATGIPSSTILATLALERLFDPVGFVILLVFGVLAFRLPPSLEKWHWPAVAALVIMAGLLVWFVYASRNAKPEHVPERRAHARGLAGRVRAYLVKFAASTQSLTTGSRFIAALGLALLAWAGQLITFHYAANAAHVDIPMAGSLAALLAINLGLLIRATPGNVGFFQFVFALAVAPFGVERNDAIAVSLLIQTLQILPVTLLGVMLAPEFIFRRKPAEPTSGPVVEESDELAGTSGEP
ncbi:MAG TPA: lysylphosphatidylglycerol synthase transmembrane domain-containing protein [Gemmatimonadaceae bacterium]|nr:lysylphosphatidylglycerol synthase transmembrane domain-containing protein [Gemmatimonadaceae bacterium]